MRARVAALAVHGGTPVRDHAFPVAPGPGPRERAAMLEAFDSGVLSGFVAEPGEWFWGGSRVRALERAWAARFGVPYAIAMNSATSCLFAAVRALDIKAPDEVIVSPWSMSASVACVVAAGARPVFADIDPVTFGLDPGSVREGITKRTRAIVTVDLFGCPARHADLIDLASRRRIRVIEDAAQAIGASYHGLPAGTLGDIGVFSLNQHKTLHCGEGGVAVARDERLANLLALVRNHGEALSDMIGQNYRMTEIEAAIATVQLDRLDELVDPRVRNAQWLMEALSDLDGIGLPTVPSNVRHVFYEYPVRLHGVSVEQRDAYIAALRAEGLPAVPYVRPLYHLPAYRRFAKGPLTEAERAWREVIVHPLVHGAMSEEDLADVADAFRKVHAHRGEL